VSLGWVLFLPVYLPDFNSVELMWGYMKNILGRLKLELRMF
jgi:transposase